MHRSQLYQEMHFDKRTYLCNQIQDVVLTQESCLVPY